MQKHDKKIYEEDSIFSIILYSWNTITHMERFWQNNSDGLESNLVIFIMSTLIEHIPNLYFSTKLFFDVRDSDTETFSWVYFYQLIILTKLGCILFENTKMYHDIFTDRYTKKYYDTFIASLYTFQIVFSLISYLFVSNTSIKAFLNLQFVFNLISLYILASKKYYYICEYYSTISKTYSKMIDKELFTSIVENFYNGETISNPIKLGFTCRNFIMYLTWQLKIKDFLVLLVSDVMLVSDVNENILDDMSFVNYFITGLTGNVKINKNKRYENFILSSYVILIDENDERDIIRRLFTLITNEMKG